jgi:hypothetical protein
VTMVKYLADLRDRIQHCVTDKKACVEICKVMPYILHLEIYVGIKFWSLFWQRDKIDF